LGEIGIAARAPENGSKLFRGAGNLAHGIQSFQTQYII
jgi:hypothetical protein